MSKVKKRTLDLTSWCVHHIHGCTGMRKERIYQYISNKLTETEFLLIYSKSEKKGEWNLQWIHKTVPPTSRNKRETWRTVELWYLRSHETEKRYTNLWKKTVRYTKHLKTGPKLDFEFLVTLCQKQRQETWKLPPGTSIIFMVVQEWEKKNR